MILLFVCLFNILIGGEEKKKICSVQEFWFSEHVFTLIEIGAHLAAGQILCIFSFIFSNHVS